MCEKALTISAVPLSAVPLCPFPVAGQTASPPGLFPFPSLHRGSAASSSLAPPTSEELSHTGSVTMYQRGVPVKKDLAHSPRLDAKRRASAVDQAYLCFGHTLHCQLVLSSACSLVKSLVELFCGRAEPHKMAQPAQQLCRVLGGPQFRPKKLLGMMSATAS